MIILYLINVPINSLKTFTKIYVIIMIIIIIIIIIVIIIIVTEGIFFRGTNEKFGGVAPVSVTHLRDFEVEGIEALSPGTHVPQLGGFPVRGGGLGRLWWCLVLHGARMSDFNTLSHGSATVRLPHCNQHHSPALTRAQSGGWHHVGRGCSTLIHISFIQIH